MSGQNAMRSEIRAKPGALAPNALDFASRLTGATGNVRDM